MGILALECARRLTIHHAQFAFTAFRTPLPSPSVVTLLPCPFVCLDPRPLRAWSCPSSAVVDNNFKLRLSSPRLCISHVGILLPAIGHSELRIKNAYGPDGTGSGRCGHSCPVSLESGTLTKEQIRDRGV